MKYLYLKSSPLGKMYLGMTKRDPYKYIGSGIDWIAHIKENNISRNSIHTEIIFCSDDEDEFSRFCIEKSNQLKVVDSDLFLNRIIESGKMSIIYNDKIKEKKSAASKKMWLDENYRQSMSGENHPMYGRSRPDTSIMNIRRFENQEERIKVSNRSKELWKDESHRKKMSAISLGDNNVSKRPEVARKISETKKRNHSRPGYVSPKSKKCISPSGKIYNSTIEAHRTEGLGVHHGSISRWCRKGTNGWKYLNQ